MNIEIIAGSPRENSVTHRVALFLKKILTERTSHTVNIIDVREWELPLLQNVFVSVDATPEEFKPLSTRMFNAHAFILATPEYNGTYTSAMKNLLDHYPKQSHKAFGIVTASPGMMGGIRATQQMQLLINALFGIASPHMLVVGGVDKKFDADGNLLDEAFQKNVDVFIREFLWLAESLHPESVLN
ncbi:NAD(P)H-dependent oxidoreductase [Lacibacter sp.]|jgi:NAD(P)H-dependent FMN reductase|uniref:NADPH-dependent FMN reductase n=1 Tax=Lacibacter sp. TaxID=1915409 RepID=UPI002B4B25A7|nr:NAD(P)H-dependent oxidoreductase [Lacibacter sp.]HLP39238.1 NAD(P)H-dependent oxidoreductase [Lacibacter sp.]